MSTTQGAEFCPEFYLYTDPVRITAEKFDSIYSQDWRQYTAKGSELDVARFIRHLTRDALYLSIRGTLIFLHNDRMAEGELAFHRAVNIALSWVRTYVTKMNRPVDQDKEEKPWGKGFMNDAIELMTRKTSRESLHSLLKVILEDEVSEKSSTRVQQWELPCLLDGVDGRLMLGKFDLRTGKISKLEKISRFPVLSGLRFPESYYLTPEVEWQSSKFKSYLDELTLADEEKTQFLLRLMAVYCEEGAHRQMWTWMEGKAGNGKSVFVDILAHILGDLAAKGENKTYDRSDRDANFTRLPMKHRRLVYYSELTKNFKIHDGKIKGDTDDKIRIEGKYQDSEEIVNTTKNFFLSNFPVIILDETEATRGRLIYVYTYGKNYRNTKEQITKYHLELWKKEKDLILSCLVRAYRQIEKTGLNVPYDYQGLNQENKKKTLSTQERFDGYIEDRIVVTQDQGDILLSSDIALDYEQWCQESGYGKPTSGVINFLQQMISEKLGPAIGRPKHRIGLRLAGKPKLLFVSEVREFDSMKELEVVS